MEPKAYLTPFPSVRCVMLPLPPSVADLVALHGQRLLRSLPRDLQAPLYVNKKATYHVTIFHFGRPEAPAPVLDPEVGPVQPPLPPPLRSGSCGGDGGGGAGMR